MVVLLCATWERVHQTDPHIHFPGTQQDQALRPLLLTWDWINCTFPLSVLSSGSGVRSKYLSLWLTDSIIKLESDTGRKLIPGVFASTKNYCRPCYSFSSNPVVATAPVPAQKKWFFGKFILSAGQHQSCQRRDHRAEYFLFSASSCWQNCLHLAATCS